MTSDVMTKPHQLIASDRVEGTAVRRPNGDMIGHIERLMIDKISGKVSYAVLSFGGFLGMDSWLGFLALMVFFGSSQQAWAMAAGSVVQPFSLKRCWQDWGRRRAFQGMVKERTEVEVSTGFHRCHVCGRTEVTNPDLAFRIASDGEEYCQTHLPVRNGER